MVSVSCFGVRVSMMFHFMFVHYTLVQFGLLSGHLFGRWLPARLAICSHCILSICNIYLFPILVLGAGFAFWLLQFSSRSVSVCGGHIDHVTQIR